MTYYTKDHEWLRLEGEIAVVGVTKAAAEALGDLVFIEVKKPGTMLKRGEEAAVVESVKAASDVYAPVAGEIVEVNTRLDAEPAAVTADPEGEGWFFKLRVADPAELDLLLDEAGYLAAAKEGQ
jgi:glycine cleavage system H protein